MSDPWASGLLDRRSHADRKLVADAKYAEIAGIPPSVLWTRPSELCGPAEIRALEQLADSTGVGLGYMGGWSSLTRRFQLLCGKLMRNRQDARLRLATVSLEDDAGAVSCDVLLIPDLADGKLSPRALQAAVGVLKQRAARGRLSVVSLPGDVDQVFSRYGEAFGDIVHETYITLEPPPT